MNITMEADYALRIGYLFSGNNTKTDAAALSEKIGVSLRFTLKILRKLLLAGIVKSYKGTHGGYMLAKEPKDISMYDVITAIDGDIPLNRCTNGVYECQNPNVKNGMPCAMRHVFAELSMELKTKLSAITFDKL